MKKVAALGVAAAVALGSLGVAGEAGARPMWPYPHSHPGPMYWGHPHQGFSFSFGFGPSYPAYPYAYDWRASSPHVRWCAENYRTYDIYSDTYHPKLGVTANCISPWWTYR